MISKMLEAYKDSIDWDIKDARLLLLDAPLRINGKRVQIQIDEKWMSLGRTDLKDDVCTYRYEDIENLEETREHYLNKINYGARNDRNVFSVIDSYSDG